MGKKIEIVYRQGEFINICLSQLHYHKYVEVAPGIQDRIIAPCEYHHINRVAQYMDIDRDDILHVIGEKDAHIDIHYHRRAERIYIIKGSVIELVTQRIYRAGDLIEILPYQSHGIKMLTDVEQLISLYPKSF